MKTKAYDCAPCGLKGLNYLEKEQHASCVASLPARTMKAKDDYVCIKCTTGKNERHGLFCPNRLNPSEFIDLYDNGDSYSDKFLVDRLGISYAKAQRIIRAINMQADLIEWVRYFTNESKGYRGRLLSISEANRMALETIAKTEGTRAEA